MFDDLQPLLPDISPLVIAGPCSAESRTQVLETAQGLAKEGVRVFRAGVWKPRTMPGSFEGFGAEALPWLVEAKQLTGMLTACEVATRSHVCQALEAGIDMLWVGARTSTNPFAVQEVADTLVELGATDIPVLVKNPVNPDIDLWVGALERLYRAGVHRLGAIHRGFSTFAECGYRNAPVWSIPLQLSVRIPGLPIITDPSHMGGRRELIAPLSQQALDMGFHGLIIESHCHPQEALSDAAQQLTPQSLGEILRRLDFRSSTRSAADESLTALRARIDDIDTELIDVLRRRMEVARQIGLYKKEHKLAVLQSQRFNALVDNVVLRGQNVDLSEEFMRSLMDAVHEESVRQQMAVLTAHLKDGC